MRARVESRLFTVHQVHRGVPHAMNACAPHICVCTWVSACALSVVSPQGVRDLVRTFAEPRECEVLQARTIDRLRLEVEQAGRVLLQGAADAVAAAAAAAAAEVRYVRPTEGGSHGAAAAQRSADGRDVATHPTAVGHPVPLPLTSSPTPFDVGHAGGDGAVGVRRPLSAPRPAPPRGTIDAAAQPVLTDLCAVAAAIARAVDSASKFGLSVGTGAPASATRVNWNAAFASADTAVVRAEVLRQVGRTPNSRQRMRQLHVV